MLGIRESFGAKVMAGLLGTVGLLLLITLAVVRSETTTQVEEVSDRAVRSAESQFANLAAFQRQLTEALARGLVEGNRAVARLDEAILTGELAPLIGDANYEIELAGLTGVLVAFTDTDARVFVTILDDGTSVEGDPLRVEPMALSLLDGSDFETSSYRVLDGKLYGLRTRFVELGERAVGTVSFALPIADEDVDRIGSGLGVEVCVIAEGQCVVGSAVARRDLSAVMVEAASDLQLMSVSALDQDWSVRATELVPGNPAEGVRVISVPLDDVLRPFSRIRRALFVGGALALLLSVLVGAALSRGLTRPVRALVEATVRVAGGDYDAEVSVDSHDEIGTLADAFNDMIRGLRLKEQYRSVLNKVVSRDVAEELMRGDVELGGENRLVSVLFADIRGFSELTEGMEPQRVIGLLNECMERLSRAVEEEGGIVDKYVGDEVMAVFGAPLSHGDDALAAVRAALGMRLSLGELNREREARGESPLGLGIGVSTGVAVAGNMGSHDRLNYTVLGDIVNLGARLCSAAAPGEILVTGQTLSLAGGGVDARSCGARSFKGFSSDIEVFDVEGAPERQAKPRGSQAASRPRKGLDEPSNSMSILR